MTEPLLDLLQIVDRSFPTGAFVHSGGLEWLAQQPDYDLEGLIRVRLQEQIARFELVFLLEAYRSETDLPSLDERYHARLMARESRDASRLVGRQLLTNACDLFDRAALTEFATQARYGHLPIAFGLIARELGISSEFAAESYAFQGVRGQVSAAQRLTRLGQTEAQRLIHRLKPAIHDAAALAASIPVGCAGGFAPVLDVAAMAHERQAVRLFVS